MVGSSAAVALSKLGCLRDKSILLLEGGPDKAIKLTPEFSNRVSALAPSSVSMLSDLGVWQHINSQDRVGQVKTMRVWDGCSDAGIVFSSEDNIYDMDAPLNYIVENDNTVAAINNVMDDCDNLTVKYGAKVRKYSIPSRGENEVVPKDNVLVELEDGNIIETSLLIGADGFRSLVRQSISSEYVSWEYQQMGLVATLDVETQTGDNETAWQRFLPTGPVALLPLSNKKSSLVWTLDTKLARSMVTMEEDMFLDQLNSALTSVKDHNNAVNEVLDKFSLLVKAVLPYGSGAENNKEEPPIVKGVVNRAIFPLGFGHSSRYIGPRTVLIGDAAHRVHPLAGQGVNLGFGDIGSLVSVLEDGVREGAHLGHHDYLRQYETDRQRHNLTTMMGIDCLQKLYSTDFTPVVLARTLGLSATNAVTPVKNMIMQHVK